MLAVQPCKSGISYQTDFQTSYQTDINMCKGKFGKQPSTQDVYLSTFVTGKPIKKLDCYGIHGRPGKGSLFPADEPFAEVCAALRISPLDGSETSLFGRKTM